MEEKAKSWQDWNLARKRDAHHYSGFSFGPGDSILNAFKTEQTGSGKVYVVACPERNTKIGRSVSTRLRYSNSPGTMAAVGCWSYYEDLPHVRQRMLRGYW